MKKRFLVLAVAGLLLAGTFSGCAAERTVSENGESSGLEQNSVPEETTDNSRERPKQAAVEQARALALEGLTADEQLEFKRWIINRNMELERAYLRNAFENLEGTKSLYWNYFTEDQEIPIRWEYKNGLDWYRSPDRGDLTEAEYNQKYGTAILVENPYSVSEFISQVESWKGKLSNALLQADLQKVIDAVEKARDEHDLESLEELRRLLHDLDYFLVRYGPTGFGEDIMDRSMVATYYGTLSFY